MLVQQLYRQKLKPVMVSLMTIKITMNGILYLLQKLLFFFDFSCVFAIIFQIMSHGVTRDINCDHRVVTVPNTASIWPNV
jgi:hypothetical protein